MTTEVFKFRLREEQTGRLVPVATMEGFDPTQPPDGFVVEVDVDDMWLPFRTKTRAEILDDVNAMLSDANASIEAAIDMIGDL